MRSVLTRRPAVFVSPLRSSMLFELYVGGAMALGLAAYLIYALIHPEKF